LDDLDPEDPFELDDGNRPHVCNHEHYSEADLYDIYYDPIFYPAREDGPAHWLMVGQPPGEPPLVVPLAPPNSADSSKCRPISIYKATGPTLTQYLMDTGQAQDSTR
jgi:hypothetical protein